MCVKISLRILGCTWYDLEWSSLKNAELLYSHVISQYWIVWWIQSIANRLNLWVDNHVIIERSTMIMMESTAIGLLFAFVEAHYIGWHIKSSEMYFAWFLEDGSLADVLFNQMTRRECLPIEQDDRVAELRNNWKPMTRNLLSNLVMRRTWLNNCPGAVPKVQISLLAIDKSTFILFQTISFLFRNQNEKLFFRNCLLHILE